MEPWFIFVVAATFLGGVHVFIQRVGVAKGYSSNLLNSYSGIISGVFGLGVTAITGELATISWALLVFAVVNGFIYLIGSNLRMDAMKYMDTTIMLPLHKFISPLFVLIIGLFFFKELLSLLE